MMSQADFFRKPSIEDLQELYLLASDYVSWATDKVLNDPRGSLLPPTSVLPPIPVGDTGVAKSESFDCNALLGWVQENRFLAPVCASCVYLVLIFIVLPLIRGKKPSGDSSGIMRHAFALWNLSLSIFSMIGVWYSVPYVAQGLGIVGSGGGVDGNGLRFMVCSDEMMVGEKNKVISGTLSVPSCYGSVGSVMSLFMLSKFPELLDTVFLVLLHKRVPFLHWYHHVTVLMYSWFAYSSVTPTAVMFGTMNYCVHAVMYFYFFASTYTSKLAFMRKPITTIQLLQMVIGVALTVVSFYYTFFTAEGCSRSYTDSGFFLFCFCLYGSYAILFLNLYRDSYLKKKTRPVHRKKD